MGTQNGDVDRNGPRVGTSRECAPPEAPGGSSEDTQPTLELPGGGLRSFHFLPLSTLLPIPSLLCSADSGPAGISDFEYNTPVKQ